MTSPTRDTSKTVEIKVVFAALVPLLAGVVYSVGGAVLGQPDILAGLPAWARLVILAAVPSVLTFASGYMKSSNRV